MLEFVRDFKEPIGLVPSHEVTVEQNA